MRFAYDDVQPCVSVFISSKILLFFLVVSLVFGAPSLTCLSLWLRGFRRLDFHELVYHLIKVWTGSNSFLLRFEHLTLVPLSIIELEQGLGLGFRASFLLGSISQPQALPPRLPDPSLQSRCPEVSSQVQAVVDWFIWCVAETKAGKTWQGTL